MPWNGLRNSPRSADLCPALGQRSGRNEPREYRWDSKCARRGTRCKCETRGVRRFFVGVRRDADVAEERENAAGSNLSVRRFENGWRSIWQGLPEDVWIGIRFAQVFQRVWA